MSAQKPTSRSIFGLLVALATCLAALGAATPVLGSPSPGTPGELYAFGNNGSAQLGNETNVETQEPNPVPTPVVLPGQDGPVVYAAAGGAHSLVVTESGQLYAFGWNYHGQLGTPTYTEGNGPHGWIATPTPVVLPGQDGPVVQAAAGGDHSLALTAGGQLYAFGANTFGELGNETNINQPTGKANPTPTLVTLPGQEGPVVEVAAGTFHSLALTASGQLYAFGGNTYGQLGRVTTHPAKEWANPTPTLVTLPGQEGPVVKIDAGRDFTLALTASGQLYGFGNNRFGQLGFEENSGPGPDPFENDHPTPTLIPPPDPTDPVVDFAAGSSHTLVLTEGGRLYAFGENFTGDLGSSVNLNTEEATFTPTPFTLPGLQGHVVDIAAGYEDSFVLTSTGQLYSFGLNWFGELGRTINNKTVNPNPTPTVVSMPGGAALQTIFHGQGTSHAMVVIGMVMSTTSLPTGAEGAPYEAGVAAAGGEAPYHWSATGLPPGLAIDATSGEITGTPTGVACSSPLCRYSVTVTVTDDNGLQVSRSLPIALEPRTYPLTVLTGGAGSGAVSSSPGGIKQCGAPTGSCQASYDDGTLVSLSANPAAGSIFAGWTGGGCSGTGPCTVTIDAATEVTATFSKVPQPPPPPGPRALAARLRIGAVRPLLRPLKILVGGTVADQAEGTVRIRATAYFGGKRVVVTGRAQIAEGRWRARLPFRWAAKHPNATIQISASFGGSPGVEGDLARRRVRPSY